MIRVLTPGSGDTCSSRSPGIFLAALMILWMPFANAQSDSSKPAADIGSSLQLFVDDYVIESLHGSAELRLHHPVPREIAIEHGDPWEGSGSSFHSVFQDGDIYRMYYSAWDFTIKPGKVTDDRHPYMLCYAESDDGIHWRKPSLGLVEFNGSKDNNIVMVSGKLGNVYPDLGHPTVFKDENPNAPADAKYKAIIRDWSAASGLKGLLAFKSPDGFHWTLMHPEAVITDGAFDSQNLAFWDPHIQKYRAYWRYMAGPESIRSIRTAESDDFIHWTNQRDLAYGDAPEIHLYTNVIKHYYRAPQVLIGFPVRYLDRGWSSTMRQLPDLENRELRATGEQRFGTALTESLFMASRDGVNFKRWADAFMRPGIERPGTWQYGQQYIAWSVVETKSHLEGAPNELSLYAVEGFWGTIREGMDALRRYTLRLDGFVSVSADANGGELVTRPVIFKGKNLVLNFSSAAAGDIKVELLDTNGKPFAGYALEDCEPVFGDTIERTVHWKNGADVSQLAGKPVRIRFVLEDADLYSFKFQ